MDSDVNKAQIEGARNIFFGFLKGVESLMNVKAPEFIYHYTTEEKFKSIVGTETIRLYTVDNFKDEYERMRKFKVEERFKSTFTDNQSGKTADVGVLINQELSKDHVFIQSNSTDPKNEYLWENYGDKGKGVCLKFSTDKYFRYCFEYYQRIKRGFRARRSNGMVILR